MKRLIPPAGTPIRSREIANAILNRSGVGGTNLSFEGSLKSLTDSRYCFFFNSGRTALTFILRALSGIAGNNRNEVIMPAYTCFSVASAIARSGLKIHLVDIEPETLDYNYVNLRNADSTKVLAIISGNLFGIPNDWIKLGAFAKEKGIFEIDDAAQSLGIFVNGQASGSFGDIGFFSFGRGKNLPTYSGGAVITSNEAIAQRLLKDYESLSKSNIFIELNAILKIILYSIFLNPSVYWIPESIPFLKLGETTFDTEFELGRYPKIQERLGAGLISRLNEISEIRRRNSYQIAEGLLKKGNLLIPKYDSSKCLPYLRLPVIVENKSLRAKMLRKLRNRNIVASLMYPSTIRQIDSIQQHLASSQEHFPGAETIADRLLTLPTHPYLNDKDIANIISCMECEC